MSRPSLRARLLHRLGARLRCRCITIDGRPYMERYLVARAAGVTVYLHRFLAADGDREVHDHPWRWSLAWALVGGYREERLRHLDPEAGWVSVMRRIGPLRPNLLTARSFHRVVEPEPETWTLFVHGPRVKQWGFLEHSDGRVSYRPAATAAGSDWKRTAPRGRDAGREPLGRG